MLGAWLYKLVFVLQYSIVLFKCVDFYVISCACVNVYTLGCMHALVACAILGVCMGTNVCILICIYNVHASMGACLVASI